MAKSRRHTQDRFQSAEIVRLVVIAGKGIAAFLTLTDFVIKKENEETGHQRETTFRNALNDLGDSTDEIIRKIPGSDYSAEIYRDGGVVRRVPRMAIGFCRRLQDFVARATGSLSSGRGFR
jgi:hypothetical protein